ncbi:tRNA wybutosine-synthesizing protein 5-like [Tubulanus polymorphus]|uniref:tRNA wybutosine-synthesizing protein 5-like n=1 Tax=Tubulanus polymorphus TaxID=672921 RepID=UPI003DA53D40
MNETYLISLLIAVCLKLSLTLADDSSSSSDDDSGHMKPFGCCGKKMKMDEIDGWPKSSVLVDNYAKKNIPLVMRNAAKVSPAYDLWTDEYFLSMNIPKEAKVNIEQRKKEDRLQPTAEMHFQEWVRNYNNTDKYMVHDIPDYLGKDVFVPPPLQCEKLLKHIVTAIMWFSSGGTKSVVHTDNADNILCLYRGEKKFVIVDPNKYAEHVPMDHPEGAYSSIDVDKVDFTKYKKMNEVEFYHVHLSAGDCMFIPYKWIHQVNSFGSNIAVNVWWTHEIIQTITDIEHCDKIPDKMTTMDQVEFPGFSHQDDMPFEVISAMKDRIRQLPSRKLTYEKFMNILVEDELFLSSVIGIGYKRHINLAFQIADTDGDGYITLNEAYNLDNTQVGEDFKSQLMQYGAILSASQKDLDDAEKIIDKTEDPHEMKAAAEAAARIRDEL